MKGRPNPGRAEPEHGFAQADAGREPAGVGDPDRSLFLDPGFDHGEAVLAVEGREVVAPRRRNAECQAGAQAVGGDPMTAIVQSHETVPEARPQQGPGGGKNDQRAHRLLPSQFGGFKRHEPTARRYHVQGS